MEFVNKLLSGNFSEAFRSLASPGGITSLAVGGLLGYMTGGGALAIMLGLAGGAALSGTTTSLLNKAMDWLGLGDRVPGPEAHDAQPGVSEKLRTEVEHVNKPEPVTLDVSYPTPTVDDAAPWKDTDSKHAFMDRLYKKRMDVISHDAISEVEFKGMRERLKADENRLDQHLANAWQGYSDVRHWQTELRPKIMEAMGAKGHEREFFEWVAHSGTGPGTIVMPPNLAITDLPPDLKQIADANGLLKIEITPRLSEYGRLHSGMDQAQWDALPPHHQLIEARRAVFNDQAELQQVKVRYNNWDHIGSLIGGTDGMSMANDASEAMRRYKEASPANHDAAVAELRQAAAELNNYKDILPDSPAMELREYVQRYAVNQDMSNEIVKSERTIINRLDYYAQTGPKAGAAIKRYSEMLPDLSGRVKDQRENFQDFLANKDIQQRFKDKPFGLPGIRLLEVHRPIDYVIKPRTPGMGKDVLFEIMDERDSANPKRMMLAGVKGENGEISIRQWGEIASDKPSTTGNYPMPSNWEQLTPPGVTIDAGSGARIPEIFTQVDERRRSHSKSRADHGVVFRDMKSYPPSVHNPNAVTVVELEDNKTMKDGKAAIFTLIGTSQPGGKLRVEKITQTPMDFAGVLSYVALQDDAVLNPLESPVAIDPKNPADLRLALDAKRLPAPRDVENALDVDTAPGGPSHGLPVASLSTTPTQGR